MHGIVVLLGRDTASDSGGFIRTAVSFPAALPQPLIDTGAGQNVGFGGQFTQATVDTQEDPACDGSATDATAPAGKLCVYLAETADNVLPSTLKIQAGAVGATSTAGATYGFQLRATAAANSVAMVRAVWAYTAP
jgi:hypothetical protein